MSEKYAKDLEALKELANKQNGKINLSMIMITTKCCPEEMTDIVNYFAKFGIEVINEDVEVEEENPPVFDRKITPFDPSKIDIRMEKITISSIISRINYNELKFDSQFQRKAGLWKAIQKSQLIESILLKIPLPAFYFDASNDDEWQIIDGLQRITAIKEFAVDGTLVLTGMEFLTDLNGAYFSDLPRSLQRRIEETNLQGYLVSPSTPKNVKFNIFKRINTGGLVLEAQEIRNALYQGQATTFLLKLSKMSEFIRATDGSIKSDRMLDREFCLRYVAFSCLNIEEDYNGSIEDYLNLAMEYLSKANDSKLHYIEKKFALTMRRCYDLFEDYAFRKIVADGRRGPVNKALFETWSVIIEDLSEFDITTLRGRKYTLLDKFTKLCDDYTFQNALRASDKTSIKTRSEGIRKIVLEVLEGKYD